MERIELRILERCSQDTLRFSKYSQQNKMIFQPTTLALLVSIIVGLVVISAVLGLSNNLWSGPPGGAYILAGD